MPKILEKNISANYTIVGWKIENDCEISEMAQKLNKIPSNIRHFIKKKEHIVSRFLVYNLAIKYNISPQIFKDVSGKPELKNAKISVSHAYPYVFASISLNHYDIGIDVQQVSRKLLKVQSRVFNNDEIIGINNCSLKACQYWICKEVAYKTLQGFYSFKNDIVVQFYKSTSLSNEYIVQCKNNESNNILHINVEKLGIDSNQIYLGYTIPN